MAFHELIGSLNHKGIAGWIVIDCTLVIDTAEGRIQPSELMMGIGGRDPDQGEEY